MRGERIVMKRVANGELEQRLRNYVTDQLTENPEGDPLGVLSFWANKSKGAPVSGEAESAARARAAAVITERAAQPRPILSFSLSEIPAQLTAPYRPRGDRNPLRTSRALFSRARSESSCSSGLAIRLAPLAITLIDRTVRSTWTAVIDALQRHADSRACRGP
jgi:hypothetical protein